MKRIMCQLSVLVGDIPTEDHAMHPRSLALAALLVMLPLAAPVSFTLAADYYADGVGGDGLAEGGKDQNKGSIDSPWLTLNHGVKQLKPGDTLYIRGGDYAEYPKDAIPSGTPEARVTVSNYKQEVVTVRPAPQSGTSQDSVISIKGKCYITLRGLNLDGHNGAAKIHQHTLVIWGSDPVPHHIRVENCTMTNGHSSGICSSGNQCEFINLKVHHNGTTGLHHGIYAGTDNNVIDGCEFSCNKGFGIHIYTQSPKRADNNIIRNNYSHHNGIAGAIIGIGNGNVAYNNVFADNHVGVMVRGAGTKFYNNTLYNNKPGLDVRDTKSAEIKNNIIVGGSSGIAEFGDKKTGGRAAVHAATNTNPVVSNNFTEGDPMFVDPEKADFRLKDDSPVPPGVGAVMEVGKDGVARPRAPESWAQRPEFQVGAFVANDPTEIEPPPPSHDPVTYFVAPNGKDDNPGTEAQPWATLRKAADSVERGDTVRIRAGVYSRAGAGQSAFTFSKAGTKDAPITYKAYGDGEVLLTAGEVVPPAVFKHVKGAIYSMPYDRKAGVLMSVFCNGLPLVGHGQNHPVPSVDEMYPSSFYVDEDASTLYVWLPDGSDPNKSDMRTAPANIIGLISCHHTIFDGLTLEYGFRGFHLHRSTRDITIRNCVIRSIASQGILPTPENCVIEGNTFQKIGSTKFNHGLYGSSAALVVRNNVFEEISGAAVHQYAGDGSAGKEGFRIYGNIFRKPVQFWDNTPRKRYETTVILWARDENWVYNNVFYGEGKKRAISMTQSANLVFHNTLVGCAVAVGLGPQSKENDVRNNIFVDCERFIDWPAEAMPQKTLDYNIYWSTSGSPKWQHAGKEYATFEEYQKVAGEAHSRYVDPGLVGPADAHLKAGSPAIDAGAAPQVGSGSAQKEITEDIDGTPRPQGRACDIGAHEYKASGK
ncbi:MAG: DUF1565 domain-containing protein [Planctomycetes bacterium]|nr:DUF1565 domain-containing protein [Planctomycetota bacterium]